MILQALYEYYQRKPDLAPEGWEWREIPFLVIIDQEGNFVRFQDTREGEDKRKRAHKYLVPSLGEKKGNGIKSNMLWENAEYMFGISKEENQNNDRLKKMHDAFKEKIHALDGSNIPIKALKCFASKDHNNAIKKDPIWNTVKEVDQNLLIVLDKHGPVTDIIEVKESINKNRKVSGVIGRCLISGEEEDIVRLEPPIKGVKGTNSMGASLVAVNNKVSNGINSGSTPAFASYLKQQGYNSPISSVCSFGYTTAINSLLSRDSQNKISICDTTIIFWAQKQEIEHDKYDFESDFVWYFKTDKDNPDRGVKAVQNLYEALQTGKLPLDEGNRFYILGLAPNSARISVRLWKTGTIRDFAEKIKQHFDDINIIRADFEKEHCTLNELLASTSVETKDVNKKNRVYFKGKYYDVPPNLAGVVIESMLDGSPYPITLLQQCIRRIRAEVSKKDQNGKSLMNVTCARAAILKAYLNRFNRFYNLEKKEVSMALDTENKDIGYLLGRLFAVLERVQIQSAGGEGKLNTTIRDRFFGAFSTSPITVLPTLLKLKNHHISKLESGKGYFESLIGQVMNDINAKKIPAHLMLEQQAYLAVGYYHQRQDFFKKKEENK